ncbi:MAG: hypothetical protein V4649_03775 [Bacteroidota bacterium]
MNAHTAPLYMACRLKSARRRKRLQKHDLDKQLIRLEKRRNTLGSDPDSNPPVPLAEPYQRGWERTFVIRKDVLAGPFAAFYLQLLAKINTVQYSRERSFVEKRRRKERTVPQETSQLLKDFSTWEWQRPDVLLTEAERQHFHREEVWCACLGRFVYRYVFNEPWRYELKVSPHIITHTRVPDGALESEIKKLENYIQRNQLQYKMYKLTKGRNQQWWKHHNKKNEQFKNTPLHVIIETCS